MSRTKICQWLKKNVNVNMHGLERDNSTCFRMKPHIHIVYFFPHVIVSPLRLFFFLALGYQVTVHIQNKSCILFSFFVKLLLKLWIVLLLVLLSLSLHVTLQIIFFLICNFIQLIVDTGQLTWKKRINKVRLNYTCFHFFLNTESNRV